jgi:HemY protein
MSWQGWRVDTSVAVLGLGLAFVALAGGWLVAMLVKLWHAPRNFMRARRERRRREGYRALTQGMVAVAAGDPEEAQKLARKADNLLAEPPLTLLLSAQAAQLSGDERAATKYFTAMLERAETEFLGLRGLLMQALKGGDEATALRLAERAKVLRPRTPWVLQHLLELQARAGRWTAAEATLIEASRRKAVSPEAGKHRRAVLLHEEASEADAQGRATDAMRLAAKAYALAPGFAPIAIRYAHMLAIRGQRRRARRALEKAWAALPHAAIAEAYGNLFADETAVARVKRFEHLAAFRARHIESHIALGAAALEARLWGEARRHLTAAGSASEDAAPPRVGRMMAELEEAEHGDHAASRAWLARAASSSTPDPTWVCDECGAESAIWTSLCANCRSFATLAWREPERAAAARRALVIADATPLLPAKP